MAKRSADPVHCWLIWRKAHEAASDYLTWYTAGFLHHPPSGRIPRLTDAHRHLSTLQAYFRAENCVLLHPKCHDRVHSQRLSVSKPRLPERAFEELELGERKLSCTVLRGLDGSNPVRLLGGSGTVGLGVTRAGNGFKKAPMSVDLRMDPQEGTAACSQEGC
jgi:hypothetical protein